MRRLALALALVAAALLAACGDSIQFAEPPRSALQPATSRPTSRPTPPSARGGEERRIAPHGKTGDGAAMNADPFADPDDAGAPAVESSGETVAPDKVWYRGTVALKSPDAKLPPTYTVYVMAGPAPRGSPPVITRRYLKPTFPFEFELRQQDIPFAGVKVDKPQVLGIILSEAGPVMVREGLYKRSIDSEAREPGSSGIRLELDL